MSELRVAALDIETVPDPDALSFSPHGKNGFRRPPLHRLVAASVLTAVETEDGFAQLDIRTFTVQNSLEAEILDFINCLLPDPASADSRLLTYNGASADLRLLRLRLASLWMFDAHKLAGWLNDPVGRHIDLIREGFGGDDPLWSLPDLCAGLGFPIRRGLLARSIVRLVGEDRWDAVAEHNLMDTVGTFLVYAYVRSMATGRTVYAASAWTAVAECLRGVQSVNAGLQAFADHYLVDLAKMALRSEQNGLKV